MSEAACIFCKITKGEIPSVKVFENEHIFAFLDNAPVNKGHTLVIPKEHFPNLYELPDETVAHLFTAVRDVSKAAKKGLAADGINLEMNNDAPAGQVINHAHVHIVPRYEGDTLTHWPGYELDKKEAPHIAAAITNNL